MKEDLLLIFLFQWRDNKQVYGLNFSSKDDADVFANAMIRALEVFQMMDAKNPCNLLASRGALED